METTKTKKVTFYTDPGHGWFKVTRAELKKLGIEDKITRCSYQRGDHVYLEEDCDAYTYIMAQKERGVEVKQINKHTNRSSRIRSYSCYNVAA